MEKNKKKQGVESLNLEPAYKVKINGMEFTVEGAGEEYVDEELEALISKLELDELKKEAEEDELQHIAEKVDADEQAKQDELLGQ